MQLNGWRFYVVPAARTKAGMVGRVNPCRRGMHCNRFRTHAKRAGMVRPCTTKVIFYQLLNLSSGQPIVQCTCYVESQMSSARSLLPHMRGVLACERELAELRFTWRLIETTARMVCPVEAKTILPAMAGTREAFAQLEDELVDSLAAQNVNKVMLQMRARARAVVDVVVRNLYERTADVGFLATDDDIRAFLGSERGNLAAARASMEARLHEYVRKYTVYDAIFILGLDGQACAAIGVPADGVTGDHSLMERALAASGYVEQFGPCALLPGRERALIYARRIEDAQGRSLGVLCLSFRFDDEMAGIFHTFRRTRDRAVMLLLDAGGRVIASSDPDHVPLGRQPETASGEGDWLIEFGGREYIACTCPATGYQGYAGPGWRGQVMVPADAAFRDDAATGGNAAGDDVQASGLGAIEAQAGAIGGALNRVVWNGQVMAGSRPGDAPGLKAILQQVSETGGRMRAVFSHALSALSGTITSSTLQDLQFTARLMIDVMDRNLYERANDCRWWALAPPLRAALAGGASTSSSVGPLLDEINRLYTVYDRLFVYDTAGCIVACSSLSGAAGDTIGRHIDAPLRTAINRLSDSQHYAVSAFEPSPLHRGEATYIYHAAIRAPDDERRVVGGIGIVFEAAREFGTMLTELLPAREGAWAAFCERDGRIIASTRADHTPGMHLDLGAAAEGLQPGVSRHAFLEFGGVRHMAGLASSAGYREYKNSGDYRNDLVAVVALALPQATDTPCVLNCLDAQGGVADTENTGKGEEYAVFRMADRALGLKVRQVLEAAEIDRVRRMGGGNVMMAGVLPFDDGTAIEHVPVINLRAFFGLPHEPGRGHVIVTQCDRGRLALVVDDLVSVTECSADTMRAVPDMIAARFRWLDRLIIVGRNSPMVSVLDLDTLYDMLHQRINGALDADAYVLRDTAALTA
jgi:chemotaxis signal transduction protein